jgi:hypothetical protein
VLAWIRHGTEAAMNRFNGAEAAPNEKGKVKKEKLKKPDAGDSPPKA